MNMCTVQFNPPCHKLSSTWFGSWVNHLNWQCHQWGWGMAGFQPSLVATIKHTIKFRPSMNDWLMPINGCKGTTFVLRKNFWRWTINSWWIWPRSFVAQIVDKFESDKNVISRELATQTQKVVEAKLTIQQLHKLNTQLKSDLQVKIYGI